VTFVYQLAAARWPKRGHGRAGGGGRRSGGGQWADVNDGREEAMPVFPATSAQWKRLSQKEHPS